MTRYTKKETLESLKNITDINKLYKNDIINRKGTTKDTNEKYTEIIAKEILEHPEKYDFNSIKTINRTQGYNIESHDGTYDNESNRREEIIAMKMYSSKKDTSIGKMLNYQIRI